MHTKENIKLLADRLSLMYGEDNAKKIMLEHSDNLFGYRGVAWSLGKRDLYFFNMYFLHNVFTGDGKAPLADVHFNMWNTIQEMQTNNTHRQHAFLLPRGTGKSLTGSLPSAIWSNLYGYSRYTVVASAVSDTAMTFINNIRSALIGNERISAAFGEIYNPNLINTTDRIELANGTMIQALSSRSTFRGKSYNGVRIELLILDDYQSDDNVNSREQMNKHWKRFSDDSANAVEKDTYKMIAMGTIIKTGDFYHRLTTLPTWKYTKEQAVLVDDVDKLYTTGLWGELRDILYDTSSDDNLERAKAFYRENYEEMQYPMLWSSYWDCLDIAMNYYENDESFKQELQLDFSTSANKPKFTNLTYYTEPYKGNVLVIDPATSSGKDNDYTAFVVGGMTDNIIRVSYAHVEKLNFDDYINHTVNILYENPEIDTVVVEKQTYNRADVIAMKNMVNRHENLYYRDFKWVNEHQSKNKQTKIDSITGDVNLGRVQFDGKLRDTEAIQQLRDFRGVDVSRYDDFPDALSELIIYLREDNLYENKVELYDISLLF